MFAVETEPVLSVNRRPTLAAVPAAEPVFSVFTATTASETLTVWLSPPQEAVTTSGTSARYGIICANNPVNFRDPFGLWTLAGGLEASGNLMLLHGAMSIQGTLSVNGWNPLDWRLGTTFSIGGGVGAGLGASGGALISLSGADRPEAWGVGSLSQTAGISAGEGLILGYDVSNIPYADSDTCPKDAIKNLKHDFFIGGGLLTPWPIPFEFHYDTHVWTAGGSKSPREWWQDRRRGW